MQFRSTKDKDRILVTHKTNFCIQFIFVMQSIQVTQEQNLRQRISKD